MSSITGKRIVLAALACLLADGLRGESRTVALRGLPEPVRVLNVWNFESDVCGLVPRGWWGWASKTDATENSRWVSNVTSAGGRKAFLLDFSQLPPVSRAGASPTGYTSCRLASAREGWAVLSFCFRREEGKPQLEVRGPHKGGRSYQILGYELSEDVRLLTGVNGNDGRPIVGRAPANAWRRLTLCFPLDNALPREVYVRFDERRGGGVWRDGAWRSCPMGDVTLTGAPGQVNFLGYGRQKVFIDNFLWGVTAKAPFAKILAEK